MGVYLETVAGHQGFSRVAQSKAMDPVDAYIAEFPPPVQRRLQAMRRAIRRAVPQAEEGFSYRMPAYKLAGRPLLYFGAFKGHCSLFGATDSLRATLPELAHYAGGKGTIQFPMDRPLPVALIAKVARHRAKENRRQSG